jgi:ribonuclease HI
MPRLDIVRCPPALKPTEIAPHKLKKLLGNHEPTPNGNVAVTRNVRDENSTTTAEVQCQQVFKATQPLALNPLTGCYTDGSCLKGKPNRIGAGIYVAEEERVLYVQPHGKGPTNTINRAELSAIHQALNYHSPQKNICIYTDSLCSMQLIQKMINRPKALQECKHLEMLQNIVNRLLLRSNQGATTHLMKVKSHTGLCPGNDHADAAAQEAAESQDDSQFPYDMEEDAPSDPYFSKHWPGTPAPVTDGDSADKDPYYLGNLSSAVKKAVHHQCHQGFANETQYIKLWQEVQKKWVPEASNGMWTNPKITFKEIVTVFKYRYGQIWNMKTAMRCKMPYNRHHDKAACTDACPLCGLPDSGGHILGSCEHKICKAMYIDRHNKAVRMIQAGVQKGGLGGFYTIMDACQANDLPEGVQGTRLPDWILPGMQSDLRHKMRPDLLIVKGITPGDAHKGKLPKTAQDRAKYTVVLSEVGYGPDTRYMDKMAEKQAQHQELQHMLAQAGWKVEITTPVVLGVGGSIFVDTQQTLEQLGIGSSDNARILNKLHILSVTSAHQIVKTRRMLESQHRSKPGRHR